MTREQADRGDKQGAKGKRPLNFKVVVLSVFAGIAAAAIVLLLLVAFQPDTQIVSGFEEADGRALFGVVDERPADIMSVSIAVGDESVTLQKEGSGSRWQVKESGGYPADAAAVEGFLRTLSSLRAAYVTQASSPSYAKYGIDPPETPATTDRTRIVIVRDEEGRQLVRAAFGHRFTVPSGERGVFVRMAGDSRVWLTNRTLDLTTRPKDWLENRIVDVSAGNVRRVALSGPDANRLEVAWEEGGDFQISGLPEDGELKGRAPVDSLAHVFEDLRFESVRDAERLPSDAEEFRKAVVESRDDIAYEVRLFSPSGDASDAGVRAVWAKFSASAARSSDGGAPEVQRQIDRFNSQHEGWVYVLPFPTVKTLTVTPEDIVR